MSAWAIELNWLNRRVDLGHAKRMNTRPVTWVKP